MGNTSDSCGLVEGNDSVFCGEKKPRSGCERGLPLDHEHHYFLALLEALSGLSLALEEAVAVLT